MKTAVEKVCGVLLLAIGAGDGRPPEFHPLDLSPHVLRPWGSFQPFSDWTFPAGGLQTFDGVPFDIAGCVQVAGMEHARKGNIRPMVEKFNVGRALTQLHLLHYTEFSSTFGQPVARVVLHYDDSSEPYAFPLLFGVHCMDWYHSPGLPPATGKTTTGVWLAAPADGKSRQATGIWHTAIPNPKPTNRVSAIEIQSMFAKSTYTLLGCTIESGDAKQPVEEEPPKGRRFPQVIMPAVRVVQCVDESTRRPVKGARAAVSLQAGDQRIPWGDYFSDADGRVTLLMPAWNYYGLEVIAASIEHAPTVFKVDEPMDPTAGTNAVIVKLKRGRKIGGTVRDANGRALADADVSITSVEGAPGAFALFRWPKVSTDTAGRWSVAAPETLRGVEIRVIRPGFVPADYEAGDSDEPFYVKSSELVKGEARLELKQGFGIKGRVSDASGGPIKSARVVCYLGKDSVAHRRTSTDAAGSFSLHDLEPDSAALIVSAPGYAPALVRGTIPTDQWNVQLKPASPLRVKVQDANNQPVQSWLMPVEWQGLRWLELMQQSDADGVIDFTNAPIDGATYLVTAIGTGSALRTLQPGEIATITLPRRALR